MRRGREPQHTARRWHQHHAARFEPMHWGGSVPQVSAAPQTDQRTAHPPSCGGHRHTAQPHRSESWRRPSKQTRAQGAQRGFVSSSNCGSSGSGAPRACTMRRDKAGAWIQGREGGLTFPMAAVVQRPDACGGDPNFGIMYLVLQAF